MQTLLSPVTYPGQDSESRNRLPPGLLTPTPFLSDHQEREDIVYFVGACCKEGDAAVGRMSLVVYSAANALPGARVDLH